MAKVQIKSEKLTPFGGIFSIMEKFDAKPTYKKFLGYGPGAAVIGDNIVGIENRDGNTNVHFHQKDTLERIFNRLEHAGIRIYCARMDFAHIGCGFEDK